MSRWGERETRVFVKLYLRHCCLWDKNHENYKSRYYRDEATKDIIEKFAVLANISLDRGAVKYKIKNLKSTYMQELKNIKERSTPKYPYRPTLKWFYDFHKCFGANKQEENVEHLEGTLEESSDNVAEEVWLDPVDQPTSLEQPCKSDNQVNLSGQDPFPQDDYILLLKEEPAEQGLETDTIKFQTPRKRKFKKRHSSSDDDYTPKYRRKIKQEKYQSDDSKEYISIAKEDEFDIYGKFIASQLRGMGLQKALRVQLKIQNIVSEARMATSGDEA